MKLVNALYADEYDHVDLISVPDYIADDISNVLYLFFKWIEDDNNVHDYWTYINGRKVLCSNAKIFVHWLNNVYDKDNLCKSVVISEDIMHNPNLPTAEF